MLLKRIDIVVYIVAAGPIYLTPLNTSVMVGETKEEAVVRSCEEAGLDVSELDPPYKLKEINTPEAYVTYYVYQTEASDLRDFIAQANNPELKVMEGAVESF